ncbi:MAG TPA: M24 family metallopeptidase [Solirubrobacteraceae bacterium]|nr:M24 family metallopeptidase [Solirubrobacteraceae bacterium]
MDVVDRPQAFSLEERARRYSILRDQMKDRGIDVLLAVGRDCHAGRGDLRYIAGYSPLVMTHYAILPRVAAEPIFLAPSRNRGRRVEASGWIKEVRSGWVGLEDTMLDEIAGFLDGGAIGIARHSNLPVPVYLALCERFGAERVQDAGKMMDEVRMVKGAEELRCAREAGRIADLGYQVMKERVRPGVVDADFYAAAVESEFRAGTEYTMDLMGLDGASVSAPSGYVVTEDSFVEGELTPTYLGVYNQLPYDFGFGQAARDRAKALEVARAAYDAMLASIRPGVRVPELYEAARQPIESAGLICQHGQFGHGMGFDVVEGFSIIPEHDVELRQGMLFVVHPIIGTKTGTRVLLGATVAVTADGYELMNETDGWAFSS